MSNATQRWIQNEFKTADFGDLRLTKRFFAIATQLGLKFSHNISSSFSQWKDIKAAYRFFSNQKVRMSAMLPPPPKRDHQKN